MDESTEQIIALLRDPQHGSSLVRVPITIQEIETTAICWADDKECNPLAVIVNKALFKLIKTDENRISE